MKIFKDYSVSDNFGDILISIIFCFFVFWLLRFKRIKWFIFFDLGDFRMIIGEDGLKVQNIVKLNVPHFQKLYANILQDCPQVVYKHQLGRLEVSGACYTFFNPQERVLNSLRDYRNYTMHFCDFLSISSVSHILFLD